LSKQGTSTEIDAILTHYKKDSAAPVITPTEEPDVSKKSSDKKLLRFSDNSSAPDARIVPSGIAQSIMRKKGQAAAPAVASSDDFVVVDSGASSFMPGSVAIPPSDSLAMDESLELSLKPSASTADISEFLKLQRQRTVSSMKNAQVSSLSSFK
jgi:hypothetical protein